MEGALVSGRNFKLRAYPCLRIVIAVSGCGSLATDDIVDNGTRVMFATAGRAGIIERCRGSA